MKISLEVTGFKTIVADMTCAEQLSLFHDNALRFYRFDPWFSARTTPLDVGLKKHAAVTERSQ
jgi:hypothetical protein